MVGIEWDWEASARERLERLVAAMVLRVRDTADEIERNARRSIEDAGKAERTWDFQTYPRVAGQMAQVLQTLVFNLPLENLIDAAADAEKARTENQR